MNEEIISTFEETANNFRDAVSVFTDKQMNKVPFEGSWTPAQVADHILRSQVNFPQLLGGATEPADRNIDEKKKIIDDVFLNFDIKLQSPDFIIPTNDPIDRATLLKRIDQNTEAIVAAVKKADLSRVCTDFELPQIGKLTGLEWVWFNTDHTIRHTRQLKNIYKVMSNE